MRALRLLALLVGALLLIAARGEAAGLLMTWDPLDPADSALSIERALGSSGPFARVGQTAVGDTSWLDSGLADGTFYCYRAFAFDATGSSGYSNIACETTAGTAPAPVTLTVVKSGSGTVTSAPAGITCGSVCAHAYPSGTVVTLTATPAKNFVFTGWFGGGCSGTGPCRVTLTVNLTISASFAHRGGGGKGASR